MQSLNVRLAHTIRDYWIGRGADISALVITEIIDGRIGNDPVYCLRSNMINGYPPARGVSLPTRSWSKPARAR